MSCLLPVYVYASSMTQHDATCTPLQLLMFSYSVRMLDIIELLVTNAMSSACMHDDTACLPVQMLVFSYSVRMLDIIELLVTNAMSSACMHDDTACLPVQVLVFSHSVRMLDIIEHLVIMTGYVYMRLDGSTKQQDRQTQVDQFNNSASVFLFLISTTAGGLGLNLTSANRCDTLLVLECKIIIPRTVASSLGLQLSLCLPVPHFHHSRWPWAQPYICQQV